MGLIADGSRAAPAGGVRQLTAADEPRFHALFESVYGQRWPEGVYAWKYGHAGARSYGFFEGETLVAHCATFARPMRAFGTPATAVQLADLMASPSHARHLGRASSPFFLTIDALLTEVHRDPSSIPYGFPSGRAMRLGERLNVFTPIDELYELTLHARPLRSLMHETRRHASPASCGSALAAAWEAMRGSFGAWLLCDRDPGYVARRYFGHPQFRYAVFEVKPRLGRRTLGFFVLKDTEGGCEISDVICARGHLGDCLAYACAEAHRQGRKQVALWMTSSFADAAGRLVADKRALEIRIMASPRQQEPPLDRLRGRWFLTGGDTDYR